MNDIDRFHNHLYQNEIDTDMSKHNFLTGDNGLIVMILFIVINCRFTFDQLIIYFHLYFQQKYVQ